MAASHKQIASDATYLVVASYYYVIIDIKVISSPAKV
jgi:hypothetical protein